MQQHPHTTDKDGFDYMANARQEEQDRDTLGIVFAVGVMAFITLSQYWGLV